MDRQKAQTGVGAERRVLHCRTPLTRNGTAANPLRPRGSSSMTRRTKPSLRQAWYPEQLILVRSGVIPEMQW